MPNFHSTPLSAQDFWSLVDLFSNLDKTKQFAKDIKDNLEFLQKREAELKSVQDSAYELETKNQAKRIALDEALSLLEKAKKEWLDKVAKEEKQLQLELEQVRTNTIAVNEAVSQLDKDKQSLEELRQQYHEWEKKQRDTWQSEWIKLKAEQEAFEAAKDKHASDVAAFKEALAKVK